MLSDFTEDQGSTGPWGWLILASAQSSAQQEGYGQEGSVQSQMTRHLADYGSADPDSPYRVWGDSNNLNLAVSQGSLTATGQALGLGFPSAIKDSVHVLSDQFNNLSRLSRRATLGHL